jgi:hypothetical protein
MKGEFGGTSFCSSKDLRKQVPPCRGQRNLQSPIQLIARGAADPAQRL